MNLPPSPHRKVNVGFLAGAISVITVWAIPEFTGHNVPATVASAFTAVSTFLVSYFVPSEMQE